MPNETFVTLIGYLTADPELRSFPSGSKLASFRVGSTPYRLDPSTGQRQEGETLFMNCSAWGNLADHVVNSLSKGMRVIVQGTLTARSYQTQQGEKRTATELKVTDVGPSLMYASCSVTKAPRDDFAPQSYSKAPQRQAPPAQQPSQDPWAGGGDYSYGGGMPDNPLGIDEDPGF
ncbi:MAG: single-stranded DNA-binding protein [Aeriscardovia sp.]|nr:single-stranded DNA-binding protein [Aeriscardovia sp.]